MNRKIEEERRVDGAVPAGRPSSTRPAKSAVRADGRHLWEITVARDLIVIVAAAGLLGLVYWLRGIFFPVLIAAILAYLFNPLVTLLESKWRWPRPLTAFILLAAAAVAVASFFLWLGPVLYDQILTLARNLPAYVRALSDRYGMELGNVLDRFDSVLHELNPEQIVKHLFATTGRAVGIVTVAFGTLLYVIVSLTIVAIYFFVFSLHFNTGLATLIRYFPESRRRRLVEILALMDRAIAGFFRGRLVIAMIMGILLSIGWWWSGVPYWFFLGVLTGFFNIVPYLSVITWPVAILLKYIEAVNAGAGGNPDLASIALWPSVVYAGVQLLDNWILTPWIQSGGQTNMSPATVLVVVLIGGAVAGVWGLLFAIPVAACAKILLDEVVLPRIREWAAEH